MRRRNAEVKQQAVHHAAQAGLSGNLVEAGERVWVEAENLVRGKLFPDMPGCFRVLVKSEQPAPAVEALQDCPAVAAAAEGTVHVTAVRTYCQGPERLFE